MATNTINIANWWESDRLSAVAGAALVMGSLVKVSDDGAGQRKLMPLLDTDSAQLVNGLYGVAYKVSVDPYAVDTSTAPVKTGDRTVSIASGDAVIEVRRGAKIEYTPDLLHSSLDASRGGATPVAGQTLAIKGSQWCTTGTAGAITSPVVGRVLRVFGTQVIVELV